MDGYGSMGRIELAPHVSQIAVARRFVSDELAGVRDDITADMQLIVSELVTNAVEYCPDSPVIVSVEFDDDCAAVSVDTSGRRADVGRVDDWSIATSDSIAGRGLGIVRAVADRVDVGEYDDRLSITACIRC